MKRQTVLILVGLFAHFGVPIWAQEKSIKIWPDKIPGARGYPSYKAKTDSDKYWTWTENVSDPTLDFYRAPIGKSNGTAVVICPGGGYARLAIVHEGSQVAAWLNEIGIAAFVLKYRLPTDAIMVNKSIGPLQDGQEAIRIVRRHSKEWNINPNRIGIMGFSAGGHLASTVSTHYSDSVYASTDTVSARPDFSILIYPVISMDSNLTHGGSRNNLLGQNPKPELVQRFSNELSVNKDTPPAFLVHATDDNAVPVQNSINYFVALKKHKVPAEMHIYEKGGHGFGLGRSNGTESTWPEACRNWLRAKGLLVR